MDEDPLHVIRLLKYDEIVRMPPTHRRRARLRSLIAIMLDKPEEAIIGAAYHAAADLMLKVSRKCAHHDAYMAELLVQQSKIPGSSEQYSWNCLRRSSLYLARHAGRDKVSKYDTSTQEWLQGHAIVLLSTYLLDPMDPRTNTDMQLGLYTARMASIDDDLESYAAMSRDLFVYDAVMNEGVSEDSDWSLAVA
jgi:hypothetical protein